MAGGASRYTTPRPRGPHSPSAAATSTAAASSLSSLSSSQPLLARARQPALSSSSTSGFAKPPQHSATYSPPGVTVVRPACCFCRGQQAPCARPAAHQQARPCRSSGPGCSPQPGILAPPTATTAWPSRTAGPCISRCVGGVSGGSTSSRAPAGLQRAAGYVWCPPPHWHGEGQLLCVRDRRTSSCFWHGVGVSTLAAAAVLSQLHYCCQHSSSNSGLGIHCWHTRCSCWWSSCTRSSRTHFWAASRQPRSAYDYLINLRSQLRKNVAGADSVCDELTAACKNIRKTHPQRATAYDAAVAAAAASGAEAEEFGSTGVGGEQPFGAADAGAEDADAGDLTEAMLQLFKNEREQLEKDGFAHLRRRAAGAAAGAAASRSAAGADRQQAEEQERKSFLLTPHPGLVAVVAEGVRAVAAGAGELVSDYSDLTGAQKSQIGTDWLKHISISSVRKDIEDMHERDSASFLGMLGHTAFRALPSSRQRSVGSVGDEVTSPLQRRPAAATLTSAAPQPQAGLPSTEAAAATAAAPAAPAPATAAVDDMETD